MAKPTGSGNKRQQAKARYSPRGGEFCRLYPRMSMIHTLTEGITMAEGATLSRRGQNRSECARREVAAGRRLQRHPEARAQQQHQEVDCPTVPLPHPGVRMLL